MKTSVLSEKMFSSFIFEGVNAKMRLSPQITGSKVGAHLDEQSWTF